MSPRQRPVHPSPRAIATALALPLALALGGCGGIDFGDSPLGATAERRGVATGSPVTGTVVNPSGDITVTLARATSPEPAPGRNSGGAVPCDYDDGEETYSCPTEGLEPGLHRVEVTDADVASEGTKLVSVAVTDDPGYDPRVTVRGGDRRDPDGTAGPDGPLGFASGGRVVLALRGWAPGRPVAVTLYDVEAGRPLRGREPVRVVPDDRGRASVEVDRPPAGTYFLQGDDGLWDDATVSGWAASTLSVPRR